MSQPALSKHLPNIASNIENMTINTIPRFLASWTLFRPVNNSSDCGQWKVNTNRVWSWETCNGASRKYCIWLCVIRWFNL